MKNCGSSSLLKILKFGKMYRMTPNWTQRIRLKKYPTYAVSSFASPKLSPASFCGQPFQDIAHFRVFPLTPILKFRTQSDRICFKFGRLPIKLIACMYHTMVAMSLQSSKLGCDQMKNVVGVAFWNFQPRVCPVLIKIKISKCQVIFFNLADHQKSNRLYPPPPITTASRKFGWN